MTCPLRERTDSSTLGVVQKTVWFLWTKCSSPPVIVAIAVEKLVVATAESIVVTIGSPLSEAL